MNRACMRAGAWLGLLGLLALQLTGCAGRSATGEATAAPLEPDQARPLFWRIESPSGAVLFLLGSMHVGPAEGWRYPAAITEAFEASSELIVEIDSRTLSPARQQQLLIQYGMLPPPQTLQSRLSQETWALLVAELEGGRLELAAVERMQPWLVANLLVLDAADQSGLSPLTGVDQDFLSRAGDRDVIALETAEFQMSLLADMSDELQEIALLDTLGRSHDVEVYLQRMVEAWRAGDEAGLSALLFEELGENPQFEAYFEALLFGRNESMAAAMSRLLGRADRAGQASFAVVGAGHVVGDRSIGAVLARQGYRVERITYGARVGSRTPTPRNGVEIAVHR